MKPFLTTCTGIFLIFALLVPMPAATAYSYKKRSNTVRTTAYTHTESDHLEYGKKTALGTPLRFTREYTSAASDWSRFPVGTEFRIRGLNRHFVIDDYGSALVGKDTIDLYFPTRREMNRWGVQHVDIVITKYGDYEKSKEILEQRKKYRHCRKMLADIEKNGKEAKGVVYEAVPRVPETIDPDLMAAASIPEQEWDLSPPLLIPDPRQPDSINPPSLRIHRGLRSFREIFANSFQTVSYRNSPASLNQTGTIRIPVKNAPTHSGQAGGVGKPGNVYQTARKVRSFRPFQ